MRILAIGPADSPHLIKPVRSLLDRGHNVCLIGYHGANPFSDESHARYAWFPDPAAEPFPISDKGMAETHALIFSTFKVFKPDVVHVHWLSWHLLPCAKISPKTPRIVSIWGSDINNALQQDAEGNWAWTERLEVLNARFLHLASNAIIDDPTMVGKCAFAAPNIPTTLLPLGVDGIFFNPDRENGKKLARSLSRKPVHIFTAMRLVRDNYRPHAILRAFAQAARGMDAMLVFKEFLADAETRSRLEAEAAHLGVSGQVRFMEDLCPEDLRDLYAISTALINFPDRDAFPVSFAEAAAVGGDVITCPLPAYDVPLVRECFDVLPDDTIGSLASAIGKRLEQRVSQKPWNGKAIELARKQYSHAAYIDGLENIYRELSGEKK